MQANIFCTTFMPFSDHTIASCAGDGLIKVHQLDGSLEVAAARTISCHTDRGKKLAVSAEEPQLLLSVSEDGTVRCTIRVRGARARCAGAGWHVRESGREPERAGER